MIREIVAHCSSVSGGARSTTAWTFARYASSLSISLRYAGHRGSVHKRFDDLYDDSTS